MISFHKPRLSDRGWVRAILDSQRGRGCERNFTTMFVWDHRFHHEIAEIGGMVVSRSPSRHGVAGFLYPLGEGDVRPVIDLLRADAGKKGLGCRFFGATREELALLETCYPGQFSVESRRDSFDYVYDIHRLSELTGKKLHAKRNHINRFIQTYPDWCFEPLTPENIPECWAMKQRWQKDVLSHAGDAGPAFWDNLEAEDHALNLALEHYEALGLEGGLIRAGGEVAAFTLGDRTGWDTYDIHFEKARADLQGAYAIINREFARYIRDLHPDIRYLNREEDMGIEGLRRAKLSYHPDILLEKHSVLFPAP